MPNLLSPAARRRYRAVWTDPVRALRTLEMFAHTEEDGGRDIARAARAAHDPEVREHLARHAQDEVRHARMFRERAAELREERGLREAPGGEVAASYELGRTRGEVGAHGFLAGGLLEELGEVAYVAMLHVAERRAAELFALHEELLAHDPRTAELFGAILKDEAYHVAWTGRVLARWRKAGRGREVRGALDAARGSRWRAALERAGVRAASGLAHALLFVLYGTLLLPAALVARRKRPPGGWSGPGADARGLDLGSQA
jgi:hypothetical protein